MNLPLRSPGKQVRNLCGTAAVRRAAPAKNVTVSMTREGWPGRGVLSAPTFQAGRPALRLILHAAPCLSGRREGRTRAADGPTAGAEKRLADTLRALCAHCFLEGRPAPRRRFVQRLSLFLEEGVFFLRCGADGRKEYVV